MWVPNSVTLRTRNWLTVHRTAYPALNEFWIKLSRFKQDPEEIVKELSFPRNPLVSVAFKLESFSRNQKLLPPLSRDDIKIKFLSLYCNSHHIHIERHRHRVYP
jgi:hypothetical protein